MGAIPAIQQAVTDRRRTAKTIVLFQVNQGILHVAQDSIDTRQEWEFFCECGREDCDKYVSLTLNAYSSLHDGGGAVLAPGHRRSQIGLARQLREEATALKRQAEHQLRRARRNLASAGNSDG